MINYDLMELFALDSTHKDIIIKGSSGVRLTNVDLYSEKFKYVESLNSEENLRFGSCESSRIEFTCNNSFSSLGKYADVQIVLNGQTTKPFNLGRFYIVSDEITDDKKERNIIAFDSLYKVLNKNCASWYKKQKYPMTLKAFRDAFFSYVGITQETTILVNDNLAVYKTIDAEELSGLDILNAICEINGVFGHIKNDRKFYYIELKEMGKGLYPSETLYPSNTLFPKAEPTSEKVYRNSYASCVGADYEVAKIDCLVVKQEENDIGVTIGSGSNVYSIVNNFLVYGLTEAELFTAASNVFNIAKKISYTPVNVKLKGNYCRELGDQLRIYSSGRVIYSYILNRTCEGIQSMFDLVESTGTETREEAINSVSNSIIQLRGKANVLERTIEETKSTITDVENGLSSRITQNAKGISSEVSDRKKADEDLTTAIQQTAKDIRAEVLAKKGGTTTSFAWNLTSEKFTLTANKNDVFVCSKDGIVINGSGKFSGEITATSGKIGGCEIKNGLLTISAARITSGTLNSARIPDLDASKITAGTISTDRLSAKVITTDNWTGQKITADMVDAGVISAGKITSGSFTADRVTAGTINNRKVSWQRFEYMTGLNNPVPIYNYNGSLHLTAQFSGQTPAGYIVNYYNGIGSSHLFTLCQTNAPQ